MEQFANNCSTTVSSAYTAGDGHIHVASTAAPFPQVGDFRISIFDSVTKALKIILKVTAIASSTEFTVTAEGTDANVAVGDLVYGCSLTAGVMRNIGKVLLKSLTASNSATLDFTSILTSDYDEYEIEFIDILAQTSGSAFYMRMSTDNGANFDAGNNYDWVTHYANASSVSHGYEYATSTSAISMGPGQCGSDATYSPWSGRATLFNPLGTSSYKLMNCIHTGRDSRDTFYGIRHGMGVYRSTSAVNALRFLFSSGNIVSGIIRVYGVAK